MFSSGLMPVLCWVDAKMFGWSMGLQLRESAKSGVGIKGKKKREQLNTRKP